MVATILAENTVLSRLSLAWSKGVGDDGVIALARPLTGTDRCVVRSSMVSCELWSIAQVDANPQGSDCGILCIHSSRLHELSLCGCNIGLEGIGVLVDALVTLPSFAGGSLDLSHNDLPRMCGILLGKLIR